MKTGRKPLASRRRIVIKIGSDLLVDQRGGLKSAWLEAVCDDIAAIRVRGADVLVVSSGAIALARAWSQSLSHYSIVAGRILLTLGDTEERRRYLNARATIIQLLKLGAVPIINENDTVATTEMRYGDNDRLAARVATMTGADLLVLSDIDGLYTAPPHLDPDAAFLETVAAITPEIEAMAGGAASEFSRGSMRTKIEARRITGRRSHEIEAILGYPGRAAMVHRDDLVMTGVKNRKADKNREDAAHVECRR